MPLPLILGIGAGLAASIGVGSSVHGITKIKDAKETREDAKRLQDNAMERTSASNASTSQRMDEIGKQELNILSHEFEDFQNVIGRIQGRPEFDSIQIDDVRIPKYDPKKIKEVSIGAGVLLGSLGGAAVGTAGGFAAAGATSAAVIAFGTASTGTTIASLSGIALTNATLATLGGGAIAAGGGGIALGTTILGATTLGVGLLVGGVIFNVAGSTLSNQADEAYRQALRASEQADKICDYLRKLNKYAREFQTMLTLVEKKFLDNLDNLRFIVGYQGKENWSEFTEKDKMVTKNTIMLVGLLYEMCQVQLVLKDSDGDGFNTVNVKGIIDIVDDANSVLDSEIFNF